jgi:hypothetical protein
MSHDDDPLDRYMDAFGQRLGSAAAPPARRGHRRRPRVLLLAGPVAAAALAITAVLLLLPGGSTTRRLDVVAEARAALAPQDGEITHLVYVSDIATADRRSTKAVPRVTTEQWSAADPVRWRATWVQPSSVAHGGGTPIEIAFADGTEREYHRQSNRLRVIRGLRGSQVPRVYPLGADPVATLRGLLAGGHLRDAGETSIDGRAVHRLVGTRKRDFGTQHLTTSVEYDVDPTTFAPVRAKIELPAPAAAPRIFSILDFRTFERLPLTAQNAELLTIRPRPGAKVRVIRVKHA